MQFKAFVLASLVTLAAATPTRRTGGDGTPPASPGDVCCQTVTTAGDDSASAIIALLGINVSDLNIPVGLNCVPITVVGGGAAGCNDSPVTCEDNTHGTLISIGCVPITFRREIAAKRTETPPPSTPSDQCCNTVTTAGDDSASALIALLGINVSDLNVPVGLNCVPITVIGGGAAGCNSSPVTCESNNWGGLIAIGCVPITFRRALPAKRTETPPPPPSTPSDQCCNTVTTAGDDSASALIALLGINVSDLNVPVGLNCVPITVIGGGAAGCNSSPVTCESSNWGGLIAIGCVPITFRREIAAKRTETPPPPPSTPSDQCCNSVTTAGDDSASALIALLGINVSDLNVPVGLNCVPITVIGGGAAGCNSSPVTCESSNWGGLIAIGCVPITF